MTYPPQQGQPYGGYPGQAGPYGPPPKNRAPVIATALFLVAVLAGIGITGFVAPGFFLGDDDKSSGSNSAGDDSGGSGAEGGPGGLPGGGSGGGPADGPGGAPGESDDSGGDSPGADSGGPADGPADGPGPGSSPGDGAAEAATFAEEFVSAVNAGDAATANGMYCPGAAKGIVDYAIGKDPELAIGATDTSEVFYTAMLTGTLEGRPLRRGKVTVELKGSSAPCVFTFSAG